MSIQQDHRVILEAQSGRTVAARLNINPKARRILLRIDPRAREAIAVAPRAKDGPAALAFAQERIDWVLKQLDALPGNYPLSLGETVPFQGRLHTITQGTGRNVRVDTTTEPPQILAPGRDDLIASKVKGFMKAAARDALTQRVKVHAETLAVQPKGIAIKDTRTRWGSCSSAGNLNFSWRLICAPPEVLDYVAAHECAHLLEMNHSPRFWAHVAHCCPDHKRLRKWLRDNGRELHAVGD